MIGRRPLTAPGNTWFRLADWIIAIAQELRRARERGRGRRP